ncbi:MAG: DNA repair protein RecN [Myxococcales bacterium]|nr:DNA repair protein RecN [Myxococcales bacterium]
MLLHLHIRNVVIIDEASISFQDGLNVFTGETGAGKSILIDSLLLALGERASSDVVRTGSDEAEVSALFSLEDLPAVRAKLEDAGLRSDDELLMRRLVSQNGRSRAYVNDRPVTVSFLRDLGGLLVEISGQHSNHHLMQPRYHLDLLDAFGHLYDLREQVAGIYRQAQRERKELNRLGGDAQSRARREEYLLYQLDELDNAPLDVDETKLEDERRYLLQLEKMLEAGQEGEAILYSGQRSVMEVLGRLEGKLGNWTDLSPELAEAVQGLSEAQALIDDVTRSLRGFVAQADVDPQRLQEIEEQLELLRDLKRKHNVMNLEQLLKRRDAYLEELHNLRSQEARLIELEKTCDQRANELQKAAQVLSQRRRDAALILAREVEVELASLGMKKARFVVDFRSLLDEEDDGSHGGPEETADDLLGEHKPQEQKPLVGPVGMDFVQFLLSSNPGEEPRALHRTASGGELSRIMLALKQILTEKEPVPSCVFDEVDAGIGGFTATIIGEKIKKISGRRQVFCITHLPQIACFSDTHYQILKTEEDGRTLSTIAQLSDEQRELEIARMLGGAEITEESLAHARRLIHQAHQGQTTPDIDASVKMVRQANKNDKEKQPTKEAKEPSNKPNGKKGEASAKKSSSTEKKSAAEDKSTAEKKPASPKKANGKEEATKEATEEASKKESPAQKDEAHTNGSHATSKAKASSAPASSPKKKKTDTSSKKSSKGTRA